MKETKNNQTITSEESFLRDCIQDFKDNRDVTFLEVYNDFGGVRIARDSSSFSISLSPRDESFDFEDDD